MSTQLPMVHYRTNFQLMHKWLWKNYFFTCTCNIKIFWVYPRQVCKKHRKTVDLRVFVLPGEKNKPGLPHINIRNATVFILHFQWNMCFLGETSSVLPFGRINACCVYIVEDGKALQLSHQSQQQLKAMELNHNPAFTWEWQRNRDLSSKTSCTTENWAVASMEHHKIGF